MLSALSASEHDRHLFSETDEQCPLFLLIRCRLNVVGVLSLLSHLGQANLLSVLLIESVSILFILSEKVAS